MCCCNNNSSGKEDFIIYGNEFSSSKEYKNNFLTGRFRLYMRGLGFLNRGTEWDYLEGGGFTILLAGWSVATDVVINGQFY